MPDLINLLGLSHTGHLTNDGKIPENELRRKFNLGSNRLSTLSPSRDPFFTISANMRKDNTDDPEFKKVEEREHWHRRYFFVMTGTDFTNVTIAGTKYVHGIAKAFWDNSILENDPSNGISGLEVTTDYDVKGRFSHQQLKGTNIFDNAAAKPHFIFQNQVVRIPVSIIDTNGIVLDTGLMVVRVDSVPVDADNASAVKSRVKFDATVISKPVFDTTDAVAAIIGGTRKGADVTDATSGDTLIPMRSFEVDNASATQTAITKTNKRKEDRCQIIGSTYKEASGLPNTTYSQKLHDTFGYTQIFKTDLSISNTAYSTMLRYRPNEYKDRWKKKLLEHKRDVTLAGIWGVLSKDDDVDGTIRRTTQGVVDYIMSNGWVFDLGADKDYDGFLEDLSEFYHPEVAQENGHMFHVDTATFNWFNRLNSGFVQNTFNGKSYYSVNLQFMGSKKFKGLHIMEFTTPHGTLRMVKDVNLDGTGIKILGVDYNNTAYRPLVGNSVNRDTTVYMKVKSIEHTGDDFRTDLIQTEAGYDFRHGETFAIWK